MEVRGDVSEGQPATRPQDILNTNSRLTTPFVFI